MRDRLCASHTIASGERPLANFAMDGILARNSRRVRHANPEHQFDTRTGRIYREGGQGGITSIASEAVRDALRVLQQRRQEDALKLKALRVQLRAGVDALERGDFTEIDEADLDGYLEGLTAAPGKIAR